MTKIEEKVFKILSESSGHMTAEEIFFIAKENSIKISLASTYRVLNNLVNNNKIRRFSIGKDKDVFDKTIHEHEHLVCDKCGKVSDIKLVDLKSFIERSYQKDFDSYDLCIHYVCDECKNKRR